MFQAMGIAREIPVPVELFLGVYGQQRALAKLAIKTCVLLPLWDRQDRTLFDRLAVLCTHGLRSAWQFAGDMPTRATSRADLQLQIHGYEPIHKTH